MPRTDLEEGRGKPNNLHGNKKANAGKVTGLRVHGQPTIRATHQQPNMCSPKAVEKANAKCLKQNWQQESHPMKRQSLNLEGCTTQNTSKKCRWPVRHTAREYLTRQTQNGYIQNIPSIMYRICQDRQMVQQIIHTSHTNATSRNTKVKTLVTSHWLSNTIPTPTARNRRGTSVWEGK